jgi:hypothetical protein
MRGIKSKTTCRSIFKELMIQTVTSLYIFRCCVILRNIICTLLEILIDMYIRLEGDEIDEIGITGDKSCFYCDSVIGMEGCKKCS